MRFFGYNISKVKEKRNTIAHVDYYTPYGEALHFGQINTANYSSMNLSAVSIYMQKVTLPIICEK